MSSFLRLTLSGALLLALMLDCAVSLRCVPCGGKDRCPEEPQACLYGLVLDVCECCMVCGKGEGEVCGGLWNMRGKCGDGLVCVKPQSYPEQASYPEGKCRSHPTKRPLILEDDDEYGNGTTTVPPSTTSTMAPNDISDLDLIRSLTYSQWIRRRLRN